MEVALLMLILVGVDFADAVSSSASDTSGSQTPYGVADADSTLLMALTRLLRH